MRGEFQLFWLISKILIFTAAIKTASASLPKNAFPTESSETYDFIVVGAGVAGSVLANRLTESGKHSVLLVHNGGYPHSNLDVPALMPNYFFNPEFFKWYATVPQRNAARENGGVVRFPVGQALGGGSSVNAMHFNRGNPLDYDNWANITGDPSWSYANMLPYFKRLEDYKGQYPLTDQHGIGGPITVSRPNYAPGLKEWLTAGRSLGYPEADPNGPQKESFSAMEFSKRFGRRVSAYRGYIQPVINRRPNLKLVIHADVRKILFERDLGGNIRASGVTYAKASGQNQTFMVTVKAKKEVIISAGGIGSPTLLLRSGVGPTQTLKEARIPVIKDLPVGKNLHDHPVVQMDFVVRNTTEVFEASWDLNPETWSLYNEIGDGPYSTQYGDTGQAFLTSSQGSMSWPDLHLVAFGGGGQGAAINQINEADIRPGETPVICGAILTRPRSRGSITLNITNVDLDPVVDFRYLEDPRDMTAMVDALKLTIMIYEEGAPYKKWGARYNPRPLPACQHLPFRSDQYWRCFIQQKANTAFHAVGSCKMGVASSPETVVDPQLKVIGISGLRVVDASVMPSITNANTQVPTYAIAEKGAAMILRKWDF